MVTLVTGGEGTLAKELAKVFPDVYAPTHNQMDVGYKRGIEWQLAEHKPDIIIHAAAVTGVTTCDNFRLRAYDTNVVGTENMVITASRYCPEAKFVYISTPCVFDGIRGPYTEYSTRNPKNYYGFTKMWAENTILFGHTLRNYLVIRTNFVGREKWKYPKAFTDRVGTYLFANDAAKAIYDVVVNLKVVNSIVHVVGEQNLSMFQLAQLTNSDVKPMTVADYKGPPLTMDMRMGSVRIAPYKITY